MRVSVWHCKLKLITLILTVVATSYGISQYYHTTHVDEREGKLGGQLLLSVGNDAPLNEDEPTYFLFSMPIDREDARFLVPIHLELTNTSNVYDSQVRMVIQYDRMYSRSAITEDHMTVGASRPKGDQHFEVSSDDKHDYAKYSINFISPHDSHRYTDGAFATKIPYDSKAPLVFGSSVGLNATASTYSQRDIRRNWSIRYRGLRVKNNAEISTVMQKWYATQIAIDIRRETGFWGYIPKLLSRKEITMYGVSPSFRFIPELKVYIPAETPEFIGFRFAPYALKLLFYFS